MKKIKLDEKYNFVEKKESYHDDFIDTVDAIKTAHINKKISKTEARLLLNLLLRRNLKEETRHVLPPTTNNQEIHSLFMNLIQNHKKKCGYNRASKYCY